MGKNINNEEVRRNTWMNLKYYFFVDTFDLSMICKNSSNEE